MHGEREIERPKLEKENKNPKTKKGKKVVYKAIQSDCSLMRPFCFLRHWPHSSNSYKPHHYITSFCALSLSLSQNFFFMFFGVSSSLLWEEA